MSTSWAKSGFSRNVAANLLRFGSIVLISFFLSPFIVHSLGATGYGVWSLMAGLLGYLGLLDLGIRQAVNRFVAHHHAVDEHAEASAIVSTALKLFGIAGLFAISLAILISILAPVVFNIPDDLLRETRIVAVIGGLSIAFTLIGNVFGGIVSGVQRFDVQCILDVGLMVIRAVGTVAVLVADFGLIGMAAVHLSTAILNLLIYRLAARMLYEQVSVDLTIPMSKKYRSLLSFAAPSFAIFVLSMLSFHTDNVVIGAILPIEFITFYAIAANLWKQANGLTEAVSHLMTPRISALASRGESRVPEEIMRVNRIATLFIAPVAITFFFRGESFIGLWMGPEFAMLSGQVLAVLSIVLWQGATRSVIINSLTGLAEQKRLVPGLVVEAVANITLSIFLIGPFGLFGVALGTLIPNTIITLGVMPWVLRRAAGVNLLSLYSRSLLLPTVTCLPFALAILAIENSWNTDNLPLFFLQILLVLPLVPAVAWSICLDDNEKDSIVGIFRSRTSKGRSG